MATDPAHHGPMVKIIPAILVVVGLVVAGVSGVNGVRTLLSGLQPVAQWSSPGTESMTLPEGDWVVFEEGPRSVRSEPTVGWRQLTVVGPQGAVPVRCAYCSGSETLTVGGTTYRGLVRFTATVPGEYSVTTEARGANLAVSQSVMRTVGTTFATMAWVALGLLLFLAGAIWLLVLLILHLTRPAPPGPQTSG